MRPNVASFGLAFSLAVALGAAIARAAPPPLEVYGRDPTFEHFAISPDGNRIAFIHNHDGKIDLVIRSLTGGPGARIDASQNKVRELEWSGPNHVLLYSSRTLRFIFDYAVRSEFGGVFSINVNTGKAVQLLRSNKNLAEQSSLADVRSVLWRDDGSVLMGAYTPTETRFASNYDLFLVNGDTGRGETAMKGGYHVRKWITTPEGKAVARVDHHQEDDRYEVIVPYDGGFKGVEWKQIYKQVVSGFPSIAVIGPTRDGDALVVSGRLDGDLQALHTMALAGGALTKGLFRHEAVDVDGAIVDPYTGAVIGARYTVDSPERTFFDPEIEAIVTAVKRAVPGQAVFLKSWDRARKKFIFFTEGPGNAGTYMLFDVAAGKLGAISTKYADLKADQIAPVESIKITTRDGATIPGYLTMPPGVNAKSIPLVVMPHGGPASRDDASFDWWAQFMATRGYAVLTVNFRGSTGFGWAFEKAGHGQWGGLMQDDVTDAVKQIIAQGTADPTKVCIVGGSYGGYAALAGATLTPELYRCAVSYAGLSDLPQQMRWVRDRYGRDSSSYEYWEKSMGDLEKDSAKLERASPAFNADQAKAPVLLVHGKDDLVVPYNQSEYMYRALKKAGKPVEYVELDGEDHLLSTEKTRIAFLRELERFLGEHLGR